MATEASTTVLHDIRTLATRSVKASCRFCAEPLQHTFVNLGMTPLCESYISAEHLNQMEPFYPLHVYVCERCFLVQLEEFVTPADIFKEYAYFSSYSESWLAHSRAYVDMIVPRLGLNHDSLVIEVASNDGYLLQYFVERGIPCLGIEPAANVAQDAEKRGVPTLVKFFGESLARRLIAEGRQPDLVIGNNVLAQVPDLNDFVAGLGELLRARGVATLEFPHLQRLIEGNQLDTIYHEHFSYFSLGTVQRIFEAHGMVVFDVEELPTHGGSLRIYVARAGAQTPSAGVDALRRREEEAGFNDLSYYMRFSGQAQATKRKLLDGLIGIRGAGHTIAGYGAPGKGNTLLVYCGIGTDFLDYTVDRNPYKQGKFLPGTHIPILNPEVVFQTRPDYLLILPWNLRDEIMEQMSGIRRWGGRFIVPIPEATIYE